MTADSPSILIVSSHGRQQLYPNSDERLIDLLSRHGVPWSATSIYGRHKGADSPILVSGLDEKVDTFRDFEEILIYLNRNINPFLFSLHPFNVVGPDTIGKYETEYFYQVWDNEQGTAQTTLARLSPEDCKRIIVDRVGDVARQHVNSARSIVVGVSGGGDSNALLFGLTQFAENESLIIHPVIVKGIPDWDAGVPRAEELCQNYGLKLRIVEEAEVRTLLEVPDDGVSLIDRFEREFPGDDFEFFGTLIIRLVLSKIADAVNTEYFCTGLNLEDVVCEQLFRMSHGMTPAGMPARVIGNKTLIMPLWMCPKRIIDGCYPKYSIENYDARYPCFSLGRNLYYSVVYNLQSNFPGYIEKLAYGMSEMAKQNPPTYEIDPGLGIHIERFVPLHLRRRFSSMLGQRLV